MSKLANRPIECGAVTVELKNDLIVCSLNNNTMNVKLHEGFKFEKENNQVRIVNLKPTSNVHRALFGTTIALLKNAVKGLQEPFKVIVNLEGVGYKGVISDKEIMISEGSTVNCKILTLNVGFSHSIDVMIPSNVVVKMETLKKISITSNDKWACGEFAAILARQKRFNKYNGSGIVIEGKIYIRKEVKKK